MLTLALTEFDVDPAGEITYVALSASVDSSPFSGSSDCTVPERDLLVFLESAELLGRTSSGTACLVGGWSDEEYFRIALEPRGSLGHIALHIFLREHSPDSDFRVQGTLDVEPQQLINFASAVRGSLRRREFKQFHLGT